MAIKFERLTGRVLDRIGVEKAQPIRAIPTPFPSWNRLCGEEGGRLGPAQGWMVVLAGIPGSGKTSVAKNMAAAAVLAGHTVGEVNFEMSQSQSATRYMACLSGVPKHRLEQGPYFRRELWDQAAERVNRVYEETGGSLISNHAAVFTLDDIVESYRVLKEAGCSMIIVDYAQLVTVRGKDGIFQRTEEVANTLRSLTHQHDVLSLVLSQFNRETTKASDRPPSRSGLQGGSSWENNANQVVLLNHSVVSHSPCRRYEYTELLVDKNRHGPTPVSIRVRWDRLYGRLEEYVPGTDPHDPWIGGDEEAAVVFEDRDDYYEEGDLWEG